MTHYEINIFYKLFHKTRQSKWNQNISRYQGNNFFFKIPYKTYYLIISKVSLEDTYQFKIESFIESTFLSSGLYFPKQRTKIKALRTYFGILENYIFFCWLLSYCSSLAKFRNCLYFPHFRLKKIKLMNILVEERELILQSQSMRRKQYMGFLSRPSCCKLSTNRPGCCSISTEGDPPYEAVNDFLFLLSSVIH